MGPYRHRGLGVFDWGDLGLPLLGCCDGAPVARWRAVSGQTKASLGRWSGWGVCRQRRLPHVLAQLLPLLLLLWRSWLGRTTPPPWQVEEPLGWPSTAPEASNPFIITTTIIIVFGVGVRDGEADAAVDVAQVRGVETAAAAPWVGLPQVTAPPAGQTALLRAAEQHPVRGAGGQNIRGGTRNRSLGLGWVSPLESS